MKSAHCIDFFRNNDFRFVCRHRGKSLILAINFFIVRLNVTSKFLFKKSFFSLKVENCTLKARK